MAELRGYEAPDRHGEFSERKSLDSFLGVPAPVPVEGASANAMLGVPPTEGGASAPAGSAPADFED
jgi:hypothetical protein